MAAITESYVSVMDRFFCTSKSPTPHYTPQHNAAGPKFREIPRPGCLARTRVSYRVPVIAGMIPSQGTLRKL